MTMTQKDNFGELKLDKRIVAAVKEMGFEEPSPIQQQAIPLLLEEKISSDRHRPVPVKLPPLVFPSYRGLRTIGTFRRW